MTVFTNNTSDLTTNVMCELQDFKDMTREEAEQSFAANIVADGGAYGEQSRFHLSDKVTSDQDLMNLIMAYADSLQN